MADVGKLQKQLNAGTVSLVVLALLERSGRAMYGYEISRVLEALTGGTLPMKQGTLYPVLRSLERDGQLASRLEPSDAGPPRRYYSITPAGRGSLPSWREAWSETRDFVDRFLELEPGAIAASMVAAEET
ncbi:MAG: PadR family transcriptional regulator [Thermoanaerobaculia bacterium]|nr:PadR family transcriptional regulator [Thermoanaerobaculia bacterium]